MGKKLHFRFLTFDSSIAATLTGVSADSQRDWRRMGHLPKVKGHARYDLYDLCELWVLQACAGQGFGPKRAKTFSRSAAIHMAWHVLRSIGAYADTAGSGGPWKAPLSRHNKFFEAGGATVRTPDWGRKSRWLADQIVMGNDDDERPAHSFYGIWPDGEAEPFDNDTALHVRGALEPSKRGAVIVLPLEAAAHWLLEAAGGSPFIEVNFE